MLTALRGTVNQDTPGPRQPIDPDEYQYREPDWLDVIQSYEAACIVATRMGFSVSHYYRHYHIIASQYMKRRNGIESSPRSILKYQLEELIYRWKINGFET